MAAPRRPLEPSRRCERGRNAVATLRSPTLPSWNRSGPFAGRVGLPRSRSEGSRTASGNPKPLPDGSRPLTGLFVSRNRHDIQARCALSSRLRRAFARGEAGRPVALEKIVPDPDQPPQHFHKKWSLRECRQAPQLDSAPHQALALRKLDTWYTKLGKNGGGGILVLPTGGGKTITAVRFLCNGPLSDGYKVLWLAHTHHLLEQAFHSFRDNTLGSIREPKRELSLRVVSGTPGHFPPRDIRQDDDVVIATLQTVANAHREKLSALMSFLGTAGQRLFIVFDEAHHAPAPSYRKLIQDLQASYAPILGLTATPVYSDETKQGWLKKLFPDGILAQARAADLIAAGVLAQPIPQTLKTTYAPKFEAADYEKWLGTYHDIPEYIIDDLAKNAERNGFIAKAYADNQKDWGKTMEVFKSLNAKHPREDLKRWLKG